MPRGICQSLTATKGRKKMDILFCTGLLFGVAIVVIFAVAVVVMAFVLGLLFKLWK